MQDQAVLSNEHFDKALAHAQQLMARGAHREALSLIEGSLSSQKAAGPGHALHLHLLLSLGRREDALKALERASMLALESGDAADALGFFARNLDRHELSHRLYGKAVELSPRDARFWFNLATSERSLGNLAAAAEAAEKACALDPQTKGAMLLRSEVTRATVQSNHVAQLRQHLSRSASSDEQISLSFALGKELHDLRRYDEAFAAFSQGAAERRRHLNYDIALDEMKLSRIWETFPDGQTTAAPSDRPARHIFIIGLPRSGTTLTERILGALDNVRSNNETNNFTNALMRFSAPQGADVFERAANADFEAVGREYDILAASDGFAGSIIEKLPFNYLYIGAILRAIPDAAIVSLRRHPLDSCFAMFRTLFAAAYPFSYRFDELARYYAAYEQLMRHWDTLFPGRIIFVNYEDLVANPATVAPEMARRCGLQWSDEALELSRNRSVSLTASAAQVREGIYTSSAGTWRNYQRHLTPLAEALSQNGIELDLP